MKLKPFLFWAFIYLSLAYLYLYNHLNYFYFLLGFILGISSKLITSGFRQFFKNYNDENKVLWGFKGL